MLAVPLLHSSGRVPVRGKPVANNWLAQAAPRQGQVRPERMQIHSLTPLLFSQTRLFLHVARHSLSEPWHSQHDGLPDYDS